MMSGDTDRRKYTLGDPTKPDPEKSLWASLGQTKQSDLAQRALGFNCLNYDRLPEGTLDRHIMPEKSFLDANCANGLRIELMFPSCWNGKDVTTENHKDHMAFPDLVMTGNCPKDFPVRVPSLLYETIWDTHAFAGRDGRFVMANGDATGKCHVSASDVLIADHMSRTRLPWRFHYGLGLRFLAKRRQHLHQPIRPDW